MDKVLSDLLPNCITRAVAFHFVGFSSGGVSSWADLRCTASNSHLYEICLGCFCKCSR